MYPSRETYEKLFNEQSNTIECPCTHLSIPYGAFLNVSFVLHQVCSSDLVSPAWLNYLSLFDSTRIPSWTETPYSRDFRPTGVSYFQLLATFCSLAKINVEDSQRVFMNTPFVSNHLLPQSLFIQQTQTIVEAFINRTRNTFVPILNWVDMAGTINQFLSGSNVNFQILVDNDGNVNIEDVLLYPLVDIYPESVIITSACSCTTDYNACLLRPIVYINGSSFFEFQNIFYEIYVGCTPLVGFYSSNIDWWYNKIYIEEIRATYASMIITEFPPYIKPLNISIRTQFDSTTLDVISQAFLETSVISDNCYDFYYQRCAPLSCSYTISKRRGIIVATLLFISVCGGLNRGLRIVVPLIGKLLLVLIKKWRNRKIVRGEYIMQLLI
ncbi:unnamed protein product [Rotaria sp. Silwood1]|nr:unnamed protein product [Rotaria sp. Silwood1]CAF4986597.1 unnamed protein product [Rotaria sp. Silwood1]CAF5034123.1 unnamed protein product [Rotaria sp. Silwood1]